MYKISEVQSVGSKREFSYIEAKSLSDAKRAASKSQFFAGTVLEIRDENDTLLSRKTGKNWQDSN